jgi:5'-nucleotidase
LRRWVFLDVGNVLWDEDPLSYRVAWHYAQAIQGVRPDRTFAELLAEGEAAAEAGWRWPVFAVASAYLGQERGNAVWSAIDRAVRAHWSAWTPPIAGASELIEALARHFRLGLIANQPRESRARLAELGWLDRFEVVALSEEEGLFKPDPALFHRALERAGVAPAEAWMVGDRLDNDIAPAAALGLATAWVRWPRRSAKGWAPSDPDALAYLNSLERIATHRAATWSGSRPTIAVDTIAALAVALMGRERPDEPTGPNLLR